MIRISLPFFYRLGATLNRLSDWKSGTMTLGDAWVPLISAQSELSSLFGTDWFLPAIRSAYGPGQKLTQAIEPLVARTDFDTVLKPHELYSVTSAVQEFQTVISAELNIADCYFVSRKAGYDTATLIGTAERCFSAELSTKVPRSVADIREAGKCLAFELSTAAGFHVLRATESVIRSYWTAVSGGKPHPKTKTMGSYLKHMTYFPHFASAISSNLVFASTSDIVGGVWHSQ